MTVRVHRQFYLLVTYGNESVSLSTRWGGLTAAFST